MAGTRRGASRSIQRSRSAFRAFVALLAVLTLFGLTRVSLSARVAEAAVDADRLRQDIKTEKRVADALEVDRGVLSTPSRLACIASASMRMSEPARISYIDLSSSGISQEIAARDVVVFSREDGVREDPAGGSTVRSMITAVMEMAAGEAQVLLVGDVGLSSAR